LKVQCSVIEPEVSETPKCIVQGQNPEPSHSQLDLETDHKLTQVLHQQQIQNNELDEAHKELLTKISSELMKATTPNNPSSPTPTA
jgi:hypothetical protein